MIKALLAFLLAGTLMVPPLAPVLGNESAQTLGKEYQGQLHPETRQALGPVDSQGIHAGIDL